MTSDEKAAILVALDSGARVADLARKYGVSRQAIYDARKTATPGARATALLERILATFKPDCLVTPAKEMLAYDGKRWCRNAWWRVEREVVKLVESGGRNSVTWVPRVKKYLEANLDEVASDYFDSLPCTTFENATLEWDPSTGNASKVPHDKRHACTSLIPHEIPDVADCPRFDQFLREVLVPLDPPGQPVDYEYLMRVAIGYTLSPDVDLDKAFLFVGSGANGKSVLLELIARILGKENTSRASITDLQRRFGMSELAGKKVNVRNELSRDQMKRPDLIKEIITAPETKYEEKYAKPRATRNTSKFFFAINRFPLVAQDTGPAFFRRWVVFRFPNNFVGNLRDSRLLDKMTAEIPGIIRSCVDAYVEFRGMHDDFDSFFGAAGVNLEDLVKKTWLRDNYPVVEFVEEHCETCGKNHYLNSSKFRDKFVEWCDEVAIDAGASVADLTRDLKKFDLIVGVRDRNYLGIRWKGDEDDDNFDFEAVPGEWTSL